MNGLPAVPDSAGTALTPELATALDAAMDFAAEAFSDGTKRVYRTAWRQFDSWCLRNGLVSMPANGSTLALWMAALAESGIKPDTVGVKAAAVAWAHTYPPQVTGLTIPEWAGPYPSPTTAPEVRLLSKGIRRKAAKDGVTPEPADPVTSDLLRLLLHPIDRRTSVRGRRDACIILLGFGGGLRRSEIAGLKVGHVAFVPEGMQIVLPTSKGSQDEAVRVPVLHARDSKLCPVRAMRDWLAVLKSEGQDDPKDNVFMEVTTADRIWIEDGEPLRPESINRIVQKRSELAGVEGRISAHSLRAGIITDALLRGKPMAKVQDFARHKDPKTTSRYFRDLDRFKGHPAEGLL